MPGLFVNFFTQSSFWHLEKGYAFLPCSSQIASLAQCATYTHALQLDCRFAASSSFCLSPKPSSLVGR